MVAFVLIGVILIVLGLVLRVGKTVEFLAGYKEGDYEDKDGLAKWAGNGLLIMGVLSFGSVWISGLMNDPMQGRILGLLYTMVLLFGGCITLMVGCEKFKKKK